MFGVEHLRDVPPEYAPALFTNIILSQGEVFKLLQTFVNWHHVFVPYVTIPNVTSPKLAIIPNIYTNSESLAKLGEGKQAFPPHPALLLYERLYWHPIT
jgi:hypothetical protein